MSNVLEVGVYVRDGNGNLYEIIDEARVSTHANGSDRYQITCRFGPNLNATRWVGRDPILQSAQEGWCTIYVPHYPS